MVLDGGAFVLPIVHEVIPVNMNTLRLEVARGRDKALITKDRMRVDVVAEFYVRVAAEPNAVAAAAQTLGLRTLEPQQLKELVEGKFVDALRTAAAEMTMEELHEQRGGSSHYVPVPPLPGHAHATGPGHRDVLRAAREPCGLARTWVG